jgi:hypothetical protein
MISWIEGKNSKMAEQNPRVVSLSFALHTEEHDDFEVKLFRTRKIRQRVESIDILIDGKSILNVMGLGGSGITTAVSSHFKKPMQPTELRDMLAKGLSVPELTSGIVPVYVCGECGDYGCGVFGWKMNFGENTVTWYDFGWDDNLNETFDEDDEPDPQYLHKTITFDRAQYFEALEHIPALNRHGLGK